MHLEESLHIYSTFTYSYHNKDDSDKLLQTYIEYTFDLNKSKPKFKEGYHSKISNYKFIFATG